MDFSTIIKSIIAFFEANLVITVITALVLLFLLFRKPKLFFIIFMILVLLTGILYIIMDVSTTGVSHKEKLLNKELP